AARRTDEVAIVHLAASEHAIDGAGDVVRGAREAVLAWGVSARSAAFATRDAAADLARLATSARADLVLLDASIGEVAGHAPRASLMAALADVPRDVGVLCDAREVDVPLAAGAVVTLFGASDHDWTALELGAWIARSRGEPLVIAAADDDDALNASRTAAY